MDNKRLEKQLEFALEINKEKNIFRQTHVDSECNNEELSHGLWVLTSTKKSVVNSHTTPVFA